MSTPEATAETGIHPVRQWAGRGVLVLASAAAGTALGAGLAIDRPTTFDVGPHVAHIQIAHGSVSHIDLGLLGGGDVPQHVHFMGQDFAANVHVDGINPTLETDEAGLTSHVWEQYGALLLQKDGAHEQARDVETAIRNHVESDAENGLLVGGGLAALGIAGWNLGRRELKRKAVPKLPQSMQEDAQRLLNRKTNWHTKAALGAVGGVLVLGGLGAEYAALPDNPRSITAPDTVLANTPFHGTELHGLVKPAIDKALPAVQSYLAKSNAFYTKAAQNLSATFDQQYNKNLANLPVGPQYQTFLYETDRHCNQGEEKVEEAAMEKSGAHVLIEGGDNDFSGTFSFEDSCTADLPQKLLALHDQLLSVRGNHDSPELTLPVMNKQGWTILEDAKIHDLKGLTTIEGIGDTRRSALGSELTGTDADEYKLGNQLAKSACNAEKPVGIIVVHEPEAGYEAAAKGCAQLVLTGHTHTEAGPYRVETENGNLTYFYTGGTAGGAVPDGLEKGELTMVGPLHADAVFAIFVWDTAQDKPAGHYTVTVHPDASVSIGKYTVIGNSPATTFTLPDAGIPNSAQPAAPSPSPTKNLAVTSK